MPGLYDADGLRAFAEKSIRADLYKNDYHTFRTFECDSCGRSAFHLVIEHHTGSKKGDFKGVIHGVCSQCHVAKVLFSFTGSHRNKEKSVKAVCSCGNDTFYTAVCERIESDEALIGFFDEGVIAGQCAKCGKTQVFVFTD